MSQETKQSASFLSDASAEKRDILDYKAYSDALLAIINGLTAETSLTVAVYGEWGSGKTTLLKMVQDEIRADGTQTIWVNVWQFGNEQDVWTAFLQSLLLKIKREMPFLRRLMFNLGVLRRRIDWERVNKKIPEALVRVAVVVLPLYISLTYLNAPGQSEPGRVAAGAGTLLGTALGWLLLLQPYLKAIRERVKVDLTGLVKSSELRERVSLLDQFKSYFEEMVTSLVGERGRTVIFIDDLDRCPPDRIVQVLDAIKLFLDIPRCVYLIGLDREIVEQAIKVKFDKYKNPETEAREYLEKIIGLPFDLPPLSGQQMEVLVEKLDIALPDAQRSRQVFALGQEPNPRKVKRTINMFLLLWLLARQRKELEGVIKPTRLAKIVVIQHSYRDLYVLLTVLPKYLGELEAYFRGLGQQTPGGGVQQGAGPSSEAPPPEPPQPPEHLKAFAGNENLRQLLTLHPQHAGGNEDANFTVWDGEQHVPIPEDEVRAYIRLTRAIAPDQKKPPPPRAGSPPRTGQVFVNRRAELQLFSMMLEGPAGPHILLVSGPGGIGKTTLLKRFGQMCAERGVPFAHVLTVPRRAENPAGIMRAISDAFPGADFGEFHAALNSQATIGRVTRAFQEGLRLMSLNGKVAIFLDNYESVTSDPHGWIMNDLVTLVAQLPNVILCIAGREFPRPNQSALPVVRVVSLGPFSKADIAEYLKQHSLDASGEVADILHRVSEGNPAIFMQAAAELGEKT